MTDRETVLRLRQEPAFREGFRAGLQHVYKQLSNPPPFLQWVLDAHGPEVWNELFQYKRSSHIISLAGLTRADGRRVTKGF